MSNPLRIALIYLAFGTTWILLTDWLIDPDPATTFPAIDVQTVKGLFFVAISTGLLWLVAHFLGRNVERERTRYRELFEHNPQPMFVYDVETLGILAANNAALLQYGYSRDEFLSMAITDMRPQEDLPRLFENVALVTEGVDRAGIWRHLRKDGSLLWVEITSHTLKFRGRKAEMVLARDVTAQLAAEAALEESERSLREMAESVRDIYYSYDPVNDRFLYLSPRVEEVWGMSLEQLHADPMSNLERVHPDDLHIAIEADRRQRAGESTTSEYRIVRPDGKQTWVQDYSNSIRNGHGTVVRIVGSMRDITDRKRMEEDLTRQEDLNHRILDSLHEGVHGVDSEGRIIFENRAGAAMFGWKPSEMVGKQSHALIHHHRADGSEYPREDCPIYMTLRDGISRHVEDEVFFRKDGTPFPVEYAVAAQVDETGEVVGAVISFRDLTESRSAEAALRISERRFYELADAMPFMVWTAEPDGQVDYASRELHEYTGFKLGENLADGWLQAVHPDDRDKTIAIWTEAVRTREPYHAEFRLRRRDGVYRWYQLHAVAVTHEDGTMKWYGTASDVDAIKQSEETAQRLARRYLTTLESITDAFYTLDHDWRFTYANKEAERLLQKSRGELVGRDVWSLFPAVKSTGFETRYRHAIETGETVVFEEWYPAPLEKWFSVRAYPSDQGLAVYFRDITDRRRERVALQESEERFRLLSRATNDAIWDWDLVSGTLWWNEGFETLFGFSRAELEVGIESWTNRIHPEDREAVEASVERALVGAGADWEGEYRLLRKDGTYAQVIDRGHIIRDAEGKAVRMIGGISDLTERKAAESARVLLGTAVEQLGEMVLVTDVSGCIEYVNPSFQRVTGYSREELIGENPRIIKSGRQDAAFYRDLWGTLTSGRTWTGTFQNHRKDGSPFTVESTISPVRNAQGGITHFVSVMSDITERLSLEEQFRQSQKMEAVGRLAGGIAHDFNNMLTVILARSENALKQLSPESSLHSVLEEIHEAAVRSAALTRQLLAYARKQKVNPRVIDLNDTVEHSLKMLRRLVGEDIDLVWSPMAGAWPVRIDPAQIDQLLTNLCVNARDAISGVGCVRIETHNVSLSVDYCRLHTGCNPGDYVMLAITDDGEGMDRETVSHIFEPFYTTKREGEGTGLGLATVYGIVRQNDGFINVYSEPGKGAIFKAYFPRQLSLDPAEAPEANEREIPQGRGETVLIVEDETMILEVAVEILEGLGYAVRSASSPAEALKLVEGEGILVDALITDVIMPGMNGRELADRIRATRPGLGVLFMSGYTAQVMEHRGMVEGRDQFVQKPFSTRDLAVSVRAVLDGRAR